MELLGCMVVEWLTSPETVSLFSTVYWFCASTKNGGVPAPLLSMLADGQCIILYILAILMHMCDLPSGLIHSFLSVSSVEHHFICIH